MRSDKNQRFGQFYINNSNDRCKKLPWPEVFYEKEPYKAYEKIYMRLIELYDYSLEAK
jgi:hypothetical protein